MLDPLPALEGRARTLEPGPAERARVLEAVLAYSERFLESLPEAPVFTPSADEGAGLYDAPLSEEPADVAAVLDLFDEHVVRPGLNPAAPGHLGYVPAGGLYYAALGDFLASVTNKYAGIVMAGPGAVRLERQVLRWLGDVVGYPATMAGDLTSGGSSATLSAVVTAREAHRLSPADYEQAVVYLTAQAHHCVAKALGVAGLKGCVRRIIPVDERYRMQVPALEAAVRADRDAGRYPLAHRDRPPVAAPNTIRAAKGHAVRGRSRMANRSCSATAIRIARTASPPGGAFSLSILVASSGRSASQAPATNPQSVVTAS
jgi:hypothetical protein